MLIALQDKRQELAFFQALLDADVYAHAPLSDDTGRIRLIQFVRPDGLTVLPFFTSIAKSHIAAQMLLRTITLSGRELMEATRGAILMLNPNNENCTLYPEEIDVLLRTGAMPIVDREEVPPGKAMIMGVPNTLPVGLGDALNRIYEKLPFVEAAYVVETPLSERSADIKILIVIVTISKHAEHAARATITVVQELIKDFPHPVDITVVDPSDQRVHSLSEFEPVYTKS